jgi:phosphoglycolate phosphatase-like HAD superfamily hydrolase
VTVGWGYGADDELRAAAPDVFVQTVDDLVAYAVSAEIS